MWRTCWTCRGTWTRRRIRLRTILKSSSTTWTLSIANTKSAQLSIPCFVDQVSRKFFLPSIGLEYFISVCVASCHQWILRAENNRYSAYSVLVMEACDCWGFSSLVMHQGNDSDEATGALPRDPDLLSHWNVGSYFVDEFLVGPQSCPSQNFSHNYHSSHTDHHEQWGQTRFAPGARFSSSVCLNAIHLIVWLIEGICCASTLVRGNSKMKWQL